MRSIPSEIPPVQYTRSSGVDIAYQVLGDGPLDLVFVGGWVTHLEYAWQQPRIATFYHRLASFARLVLFDKRGTGLSERYTLEHLPSLDERMDDLRAVLDAVGLERAAIFGFSEGAALAQLFAATYPARTRALVLYGAFARRVSGPGYGTGPSLEEWDRYIASIADEWGGPVALDMVAPSVADDPAVRDWWATYLRLGASPSVATAILRSNAMIDIRSLLPSIQAPTLVVHRAGDHVFPVASARYIAEHIPGARLVELPGEDHQFWAGDADALLDEIEEFLTGERRALPTDRALATLLFTDIVDSTARLAAVGDATWRALLDSHDQVVRSALERYGGIEVAHTGDGFVARFDGPSRAVLAAVAIRDGVQRIGLDVRIGVHTGEIELQGDEIRGINVHVASRVMAAAAPGEILASRTVRDLVVGSGIEFGDGQEHRLKGVPDVWNLAPVISPATLRAS